MSRFGIPSTSILVVTMAAISAQAAPGPATSRQWRQYLEKVECRIAREQRSPASFLPSVQDPAQRERLRKGEILVERFQPPVIEGGLIHHWAATVFIPGATLNEVQAVTRDISNFSRYYAPEVVAARVLSNSPQEETVLIRLKKDYIATVVLDAEYRVRFGNLDATHLYSSSRSVRIQEVQDPGMATESLVPSAHDHGFLWHMNSYWSYVQAPEGVYIRCETVSLSRDVPFGMGWLIGPLVNRMPRDSLRSTLEATRTAVLSFSANSISKNLEQSQ
jgi:hypothetical protein